MNFERIFKNIFWQFRKTTVFPSVTNIFEIYINYLCVYLNNYIFPLTEYILFRVNLCEARFVVDSVANSDFMCYQSVANSNFAQYKKLGKNPTNGQPCNARLLPF